MHINKRKTKVMALSVSLNELNIDIDEVNLENIDKSNYAGVTIDRKPRGEAEIEQRITKILKLYHALSNEFLNRRKISAGTKIRIYKAIYRPALIWLQPVGHYKNDKQVTSSRNEIIEKS